jgi:hypothetical protein
VPRGGGGARVGRSRAGRPKKLNGTKILDASMTVLQILDASTSVLLALARARVVAWYLRSMVLRPIEMARSFVLDPSTKGRPMHEPVKRAHWWSPIDIDTLVIIVSLTIMGLVIWMIS